MAMDFTEAYFKNTSLELKPRTCTRTMRIMYLHARYELMNSRGVLEMGQNYNFSEGMFYPSNITHHHIIITM